MGAGAVERVPANGARAYRAFRDGPRYPGPAPVLAVGGAPAARTGSKGPSSLGRSWITCPGRQHRPEDATLTGVTHGLGRVLVVDDDEVIRRLIAVNLQLEGFDVETAVDGQDCLARVADIDPDV